MRKTRVNQLRIDAALVWNALVAIATPALKKPTEERTADEEDAIKHARRYRNNFKCFFRSVKRQYNRGWRLA